jgi:DNA-binding transcriptional regulator YhcF (GntR family)
MSPDHDFLQDLDPDDPRTPSRQIANQLRAAILSRKLQPGDQLPSQPELAKRYGVARETIKNAMRYLTEERLIITRQGSGAYVRARTERQVGLRPHLEAAFQREHVTIDFAGFSGETLNNTLSEVLDKVRAGRLTPESLRMRILTSDTSAPMVIPRRVDASETDHSLQKRADRIARRSLDSIIDSVTELADMGILKSANVEVRVNNLTPWFKLYIFNTEEVFYGFYPIVERTVTLDGESATIYDLMGKDAILFEFSSTDEDETSNGPQYVEEAKQWFDSVWSTVAQEYSQ